MMIFCFYSGELELMSERVKSEDVSEKCENVSLVF